LRYLTTEQARGWAAERGITDVATLGRQSQPSHLNAVRCRLTNDSGQELWLARFIAQSLSPRSACLLWVTETGVWASSENWHLYYRLRQSYQNFQLIEESPGHLFLDYEEADLVSFLQIGILSGWDMHVVPELSYGGGDHARAFLSHDEWMVLAHAEKGTVAAWTESLRQAGCQLLTPEAA